MGKMQRTKGATYERDIVKKMTAALGVPCERNLEQTRDGGHDVKTSLYLVTEIKRRARPLCALKWLEQADASSKDGVSLVVTRGDNSPDLAVQYFDDWLVTYKKALLWDLIYGEGTDGDD